MSKLFVLSGNICVGKSTLLNELQMQYPGKALFFREPVEQWRPYLNQYYKNPTEENCYQLQLCVCYHFAQVTLQLQQLFCASTDSVVFIERSPLDTLAVFVKNLEFVFTTAHLSSLRNLLFTLLDQPLWKTAHYIYLDCDNIELLFERVKLRENPSLQKSDCFITKDYLAKLQKLYKELVENSEQQHGIRYDIVLDMGKTEVKQVTTNLLKVIKRF